MLLQQAPPLKVGAVRLLVDDPSKVGAKDQGLRASNVLAGSPARWPRPATNC